MHQKQQLKKCIVGYLRDYIKVTFLKKTFILSSTISEYGLSLWIRDWQIFEYSVRIRKTFLFWSAFDEFVTNEILEKMLQTKHWNLTKRCLTKYDTKEMFDRSVAASLLKIKILLLHSMVSWRIYEHQLLNIMQQIFDSKSQSLILSSRPYQEIVELRMNVRFRDFFHVDFKPSANKFLCFRDYIHGIIKKKTQ